MNLGIEYRRTRPYSPWQNGKVERSHRLDSEFYARKRFLSYEKMIRSVKKNCSRYNNTARKVLGFKTPNQLVLEYKERVRIQKLRRVYYFFTIFVTYV
jgi:IS30 family transposase